MGVTMNAYASLLVMIDPDKPVDELLSFATTLAVAHGAVLHICVPVKPVEFSGWASEAQRTRENNQCLAQLQSWLRAKLAQWPAPAKVVCTYPWSESLADTLLTTQGRLQPDLVIKLQEDHAAFGWPLVTPPDWRLLRECRAPLLLLVPPAMAGSRRVIAALDLMPVEEGHSLDEDVINAALNLAEPIKADVDLVHAFEFASMQVATEGAGQTWTQLLARQRRQCETRLAHAAQSHHLPVEHCHMLEGRAVPTLARMVPNAGDLLVMGRSRHEGLETWLGTTPERVLARHPAYGLLVVGPLDHEPVLHGYRRPLRERLDALVGMMFPD